ncbi:MAG TPA: 1-acyl-sn-glycerol-3-phosphate acyltransferase [Ferrovibrio sp.]|uniref:lysophospholipid acyltransferase family protein n=1 Tax=Ferrovibrio sp. TaxID=1917215 RepID=UPI002ED6615C
MMTARAIATLVLFMAWTLLLIPVQMLLIKIGSPWMRLLPHLYHRSVAWLLRLKIRKLGEPSTAGPVLFVSNHISWLDIVALSAALPASFIAKREVADWPFFGTLARLQRTVFVDRNNRHRTAAHRDEIVERLEAGDSLILFPEGTSSDGLRIHNFKSAFFGVAEQAVRGRLPIVQPVSLGYCRLNHMPVGRRWMRIFAWVGDEDLVPHLWRFLKSGPSEAVVEFHQPVTMAEFASRKGLAAWCHQRVLEGLSDINAGRAPGRRTPPQVFAGPRPPAQGPSIDGLANGDNGNTADNGNTGQP